MTRPPRAAWITAATINLHAGLATPSVPRLMRRRRVHVAALQEVRNLNRLRAVLKAAKPGRWGVWPADDVTGTAIVYDTRRLAFLDGGNTLITQGVGHGAPRLGWTPERRLTFARFRDRVTGRVVVFYSMHTWAIGRNGANWVRSGHVNQVTAFAEHAGDRAEDRVVIVGMDGNEDLDEQTGPVSIRTQFARHDLQPSFELAGVRPDPTQLHGDLVLDGVFWRTAAFVTKTTHRVRRIGRGADHRAVVSSSLITPKESR